MPQLKVRTDWSTRGAFAMSAEARKSLCISGRLKKMNAVCVFADALQPGRTSAPVIAPSSLNFLLKQCNFLMEILDF